MTRYVERPVTAQDLAYLIWNLWPRGLEELGRLGLTPAQALHTFLRYAQMGRSGVLCCDQVPVMASGIFGDAGEFVTWFQATNAFTKHYREITRTLRRECEKHEGPLVIYSVAVHPLTARWFKSLGFEATDWQGTTAEGWPLYKFRRS